MNAHTKILTKWWNVRSSLLHQKITLELVLALLHTTLQESERKERAGLSRRVLSLSPSSSLTPFLTIFQNLPFYRQQNDLNNQQTKTAGSFLPSILANRKKIEIVLWKIFGDWAMKWTMIWNGNTHSYCLINCAWRRAHCSARNEFWIMKIKLECDTATVCVRAYSIKAELTEFGHQRNIKRAFIKMHVGLFPRLQSNKSDTQISANNSDSNRIFCFAFASITIRELREIKTQKTPKWILTICVFDQNVDGITGLCHNCFRFEILCV